MGRARHLKMLIQLRSAIRVGESLVSSIQRGPLLTGLVISGSHRYSGRVTGNMRVSHWNGLDVRVRWIRDGDMAVMAEVMG